MQHDDGAPASRPAPPAPLAMTASADVKAVQSIGAHGARMECRGFGATPEYQYFKATGRWPNDD